MSMGSNTDIEAIRARAYQIWDEEGRPDGREHDHWRQASRELGVEATDTDGGPSIDPDLPGSPGTASNGFEDAALASPSDRKPRAATGGRA